MKIRRKNNPWVLISLLTILTATITTCTFLVFSPDTDIPTSQSNNDATVTIQEDTVANPEPIPPEKIDFQPIVDEWVTSIGGEKGILIYDLDLNEIVGSYDADDTFATASLYKLFVVYEGYVRIERGEWQADDPAGFTGYSISECLDLAIRESNSACAETLWSEIGREEMENIIEQNYNLKNSSAKNLISTPADIATMIKIFYTHPDLKNEKTLAQIKDSFLNQPITEYNWRQGLPSGFDVANVYNKVGWEYNADAGYWNIYNDAAIIEFPDQDRHFIVVVMTNKIPFSQIKLLGQMIEQKIINMY